MKIHCEVVPATQQGPISSGIFETAPGSGRYRRVVNGPRQWDGRLPHTGWYETEEWTLEAVVERLREAAWLGENPNHAEDYVEALSTPDPQCGICGAKVPVSWRMDDGSLTADFWCCGNRQYESWCRD
jgi:hypothetical protein